VLKRLQSNNALICNTLNAAVRSGTPPSLTAWLVTLAGVMVSDVRRGGGETVRCGAQENHSCIYVPCPESTLGSNQYAELRLRVDEAMKLDSGWKQS